MDPQTLRTTSRFKLVILLISLVLRKRQHFQALIHRLEVLGRVQRIVETSYQQTSRMLSEEFPGYFPVHRVKQRLLGLLRNKCAIEQKMNCIRELNAEILLNSAFTLAVQPLVQLSTLVKEIIRQHFIANMEQIYSPLNNPTEIAEYILNELFETLFDNGIKNIKQFVMHNAAPVVARLDPNAMLRYSNLVHIYEQIYSSVCGIDTPDLVKPSDNRRLSEITFKHFSRSFDSLKSSRSSDQLFEEAMLFTDFADIMVHQERTNILNSVFVGQQMVRAPAFLNDAVFIWLGDIAKSKIFSDSDYMMRIIEKTDLNCKQEKYRPSLCRISEQLEEESDRDSSPRRSRKPHEFDFVVDTSTSPVDSQQMLESKVKLQEYLKMMCCHSIDLIRSVNYQIIYHFALQDQFLNFQAVMQRYSGEHRLWWYALNLVYKTTDQIFLNPNAHLIKLEEFQGAIKKALFAHSLTNRQARITRNGVAGYDRYRSLDSAMKEFVRLYLNIQ